MCFRVCNVKRQRQQQQHQLHRIDSDAERCAEAQQNFSLHSILLCSYSRIRSTTISQVGMPPFFRNEIVNAHFYRLMNHHHSLGWIRHNNDKLSIPIEFTRSFSFPCFTIYYVKQFVAAPPRPMERVFTFWPYTISLFPLDFQLAQQQ